MTLGQVLGSKVTLDCEKGVVPSMGHTVWLSSDGTWATHLPLKKEKYQHTLGMLTLCPLWRKRTSESQLRGKLKRD